MLDQRPPRTAPRRPSPLQRDLRRWGRVAAGWHRRWGWRAWAVPALVVLTVVVLTHTGGGSPGPARPAAASPAPSAAPTARDRQLGRDDAGTGRQQEVLASDALPDGAPYTQQGAGTFHTVPGRGPVVGTGPLHTYTVDVENGVTGVDETAFAATVQTVLSDSRSWIGRSGTVSLQRVDSGPVSWHVTLTSAMTVRSLCGYELPIETSCWAPDADRVVLNVARWVRGDVAYIGDLDAYRVYMVNHEDGHALGHEHVTTCLANGYAPVMMQQTITTTASDGHICQANPWPDPPGVALGPDPRGPSAAAVG